MNGRVVNKKDLELFLKSSTIPSSDSPKTLMNLKSTLMKSLSKNKSLPSPRVKISGPIVKNETEESSNDYTDIFNFEEILKDKNNEIRIQFSLFLQKFGSEFNLLLLHEQIELYKYSNSNFIVSIKDIGQKGVSKASTIIQDSKNENDSLISPGSLKNDLVSTPKIPPRRTPPTVQDSSLKTPKIPPRRNVPSLPHDSTLNHDLNTPIVLPRRTKSTVETPSIPIRKTPVSLLNTQDTTSTLSQIKKNSTNQNLNNNKSLKTSHSDDYKTIALKIKKDFFDKKSKYFIDRKELHIINFNEIEFKIDSFNVLDSKIIKILQKEHFGNFVKSAEFVKLLKEIPEILTQKSSSPKSPQNVISPRSSKHLRMKSLTTNLPSVKESLSPRNSNNNNSNTPRGTNSSPRSKSPFQEKLPYEESKMDQIFNQLMKNPKSEYRNDFKKYLELVSAIQIFNLHESIEFYQKSSLSDRKIQSVVLQKIMIASSKTKDLLTPEKIEKLETRFKTSPVDLYDELDDNIHDLLNKVYYKQFFILQCEKYTNE